MNSNDGMTVDPELVRRDQVGDIFKHTDGHRYKVTKKTLTAIAVERYYWFDGLYDWLVSKIGGKNDSDTDL